MRILVLGAAGFIGRYVVAELLAAGHQVVCGVRRPDEIERAFPAAEVFSCDLSKRIDSTFWAQKLAGADIVINLAGILRGKNVEKVHVDGPRAVYAVCRDAGVKRVVLVSAISARADVSSDYAGSKLRGEQVLRESGLAWTVLRPSLVYAKGSYGGTSLLRGLAGLPFIVPVPDDGRFLFTPIHAADLARTLRLVCESDTCTASTLEPVGPETLSLRDLLSKYRTWLGFPAARMIPIPMWTISLLARLGDVASDGPISTNSFVQLIAGNAGDSTAFAAAIGFAPRSLDDALAREPAEVQDRWHARLYFLAPLLRAALVAMWLISGLLGFYYGEPITHMAAAALHLPNLASWPMMVGASTLDVAIGTLLILDRRGRISTMAQTITVVAYTLALTMALPQLWLDPLGPLLKNLPVLGAIFAYGAVSDQR